MPFNVDALSVITDDGDNFINGSPFIYISKLTRYKITVPIGAKSDGASTPHIIWWLFPPFGKYWMAAFLHDYLYRMSLLPKSICDNIFLEAMNELHTKWWSRTIIYLSVKWFGGKAFSTDRRLEFQKGI